MPKVRGGNRSPKGSPGRATAGGTKILKSEAEVQQAVAVDSSPPFFFEISMPVSPVALQRPRFGWGGNVYTPKRTQKAKDDIGFLMAPEMRKRGLRMTNAPVAVSINARFAPEKSWPARYRHLALLNVWKGGPPDIDNVVKTVFDAMTKVVLHDDRQIVVLLAAKTYSIEAGIDVVVVELRGETDVGGIIDRIRGGKKCGSER